MVACAASCVAGSEIDAAHDFAGRFNVTLSAFYPSEPPYDFFAHLVTSEVGGFWSRNRRMNDRVY
jgi:hypothetical protein